MTALIERLETAGVRVSLRGEDGLHLDAPQGVLTADLIEAVRQAKPRLIVLLKGAVERRVEPVVDRRQEREVETSLERVMEAMPRRAWIGGAEVDLRALALRQAERKGWPAVRIRPGERVLAGQECWERFVACAFLIDVGTALLGLDDLPEVSHGS